MSSWECPSWLPRLTFQLSSKLVYTAIGFPPGESETRPFITHSLEIPQKSDWEAYLGTLKTIREASNPRAFACLSVEILLFSRTKDSVFQCLIDFRNVYEQLFPRDQFRFHIKHTFDVYQTFYRASPVMSFLGRLLRPLDYVFLVYDKCRALFNYWSTEKSFATTWESVRWGIYIENNDDIDIESKSLIPFLDGQNWNGRVKYVSLCQVTDRRLLDFYENEPNAFLKVVEFKNTFGAHVRNVEQVVLTNSNNASGYDEHGTWKVRVLCVDRAMEPQYSWNFAIYFPNLQVFIGAKEMRNRVSDTLLLHPSLLSVQWTSKDTEEEGQITLRRDLVEQKRIQDRIERDYTVLFPLVQIQKEHARFAWAYVAVVVAFTRANKANVLKDSIYALMPFLLELCSYDKRSVSDSKQAVLDSKHLNEPVSSIRTKPYKDACLVSTTDKKSKVLFVSDTGQLVSVEERPLDRWRLALQYPRSRGAWVDGSVFSSVLPEQEGSSSAVTETLYSQRRKDRRKRI